MRPVTWPDNFFYETTLLIDDETLRHTPSAIEKFDGALGIEHGSEGEAIITHEWLHNLRPERIKTDGEHFETTAVEPFMEPLHGWHLFDTGRTPRRPHVYKHNLTTQG